jgi:hypothetical protein
MVVAQHPPHRLRRLSDASTAHGYGYGYGLCYKETRLSVWL